MSISLYVELNKLHKNGTLELKRDPSRHRPGEGAYAHKGHRIQIKPNYIGPAPGKNIEVFFEQAHDVAWCKETDTFLAAAPCAIPEETEQQQ